MREQYEREIKTIKEELEKTKSINGTLNELRNELCHEIAYNNQKVILEIKQIPQQQQQMMQPLPKPE